MHFFHRVALIAKYQRGVITQPAQQAVKQIHFIIILPFYRINAEAFQYIIFLGEIKFQRIDDTRKSRNSHCIGSRSEYAFIESRNITYDNFHLFGKTHFERLIKLIEYKYPNGVQLKVSPFDMILQPTGSSDK